MKLIKNMTGKKHAYRRIKHEQEIFQYNLVISQIQVMGNQIVFVHFILV